MTEMVEIESIGIGIIIGQKRMAMGTEGIARRENVIAIVIDIEGDREVHDI